MWYHYLWWPLCTLIYYCVYTWLGIKTNLESGKWTIIMFVVGATCPFWLVVCIITKRMMFDALLYDLLMLGAFIGTMTYFGHQSMTHNYQWIGVGLVVSGMILIKIGLPQ